MNYKCGKCNEFLVIEDNQLICGNCGNAPAFVENNIVVYKGSEQKTDFFDKQSIERLGEKYINYDINSFKKDLEKTNLSNMDILNKKIGVTSKFWWEKYIGKIENKNVLEVGCGVNYLVPYWLYSKNDVVAFDISQEAVLLLKNVINNLKLDEKKINLFVCDVEKLNIDMKFDVISINNMLHHIEEIEYVLFILSKMLTKKGKILIVEPNYYYPFRWIVETDIFGKFNIVKTFFEKNSLIEEGEKAIKFKEIKRIIVSLGLNIEVNIADPNYIGYATIYFLDSYPKLSKVIYLADKYVFSRIVPKVFTPFEYLIISK